ncbi:SDR family NAD(P)-dependent oxidoreductase [Sphingomonas sp. 37zxx]|uniref:SDR family NAD(P)-dependent oxidoreductase n=1 Tax=Sphingomonas sp. 37zxx TaxID=1550073 RepID=UPI00053BDB4B|nr:SDR family oxidoreductase [Sphingomonas sp. 37zxx]
MAEQACKGGQSDRVALVLGGGSAGEGWSNGQASAVQLAVDGYHVVVADRSEAAARQSCDLIHARGGAAIAVTCNVGDTRQLVDAIGAAHGWRGRLDALLFNVGLSGSGAGLDAYGEDEWDRAFAVNARAAFTAYRTCVPLMRENGFGRLIAITSIAAKLTSGRRPNHAYAASKAALTTLTRSVAVEVGQYGITANCVVPGMIDTPHASLAIRRSRPPEEAEAMLAKRALLSPTNSQGSPWDIARAVAFVAHPDNGYVNGTEIVVDGGVTNLMPAMA